MKPYLTDDEILEICEPLEQPAALCRHLKAMGLIVNQKPNGKPLVGRKHFEAVTGGLPIGNQTSGPVINLRDRIRERHGATEKKQPV